MTASLEKEAEQYN